MPCEKHKRKVSEMAQEVKLPALGEDAVDEAVVSYWLVEEGEEIHEGDDLLELTTDKAAFSVPSPVSGKVMEMRVKEGDEVKTGDVLCMMEPA